MTVPVRLAKRLAEVVHCSRREAELYISGGWVKVDGQVVAEPQFMVAQQKVELHPEATLVPLAPVTILYHQSSNSDMNANAIKQLICSDTCALDDRSSIHVIDQHFVRLIPIMPLEIHASGLTVYSQDFRVTRKLTDDAAMVEQEYVVGVSGNLIVEGLKLLNHGLSFNGKALQPIKVSWQNETHLRFALKGMKPGQIEHMCKCVGLQVEAMKRIRIGRVSMSKLPLGRWRYLLPHEKF